MKDLGLKRVDGGEDIRKIIMPRKEILNFAQEVLDIKGAINISPLEKRGSDRNFFRLKWKGMNSVILIHYDPHRIENNYYADIAIFLHKIGIPVPKLIHHDQVRCLILIEDLGDTNLWSLRDTPWENRKVIYKKILSIAYKLHSFQEENPSLGTIRLMEAFDPELYRWEQRYFIDNFIRDFLGIELEPPYFKELDMELSYLAERLSRGKRSLIHRDLQSHNVMLHNGEAFFIDFQGMRLGNPFYDLGSLLFDPYVNLTEAERKELLYFYYSLAKRDIDLDDFKIIFMEASSQRLMQCLGAYGFLALKKGIKSYLKYIPSAIRNLKLVTSNLNSLPRLHGLSLECECKLLTSLIE